LKKGFSNLVGALIGVMVAVIVGVAVTIPVIQDTINNANLTGITQTIVSYLPLMIAVVIFAAIASLVYFR
jgi:uncharacterized membrane protein required for colicin V production